MQQLRIACIVVRIQKDRQSVRTKQITQRENIKRQSRSEKKGAHRKDMDAWKAHPGEEAILHAPGRQSLARQLAAMEMRRKVKDFTSHIINR